MQGLWHCVYIVLATPLASFAKNRTYFYQGLPVTPNLAGFWGQTRVPHCHSIGNGFFGAKSFTLQFCHHQLLLNSVKYTADNFQLNGGIYN